MGQTYEPTAIDNLYDHAFKEMHEILGGFEPQSLFGDLHDSTDKALVVFRDLLNASVCAQAGVYQSIKDDKNQNLALIAGVEFHIDHAEHELGLLLHALKRAKAALVTELANRTK